MIIMSVDLGKARTGIAVSDSTESFAFPKTVITEYSEERLVQKICAAAKEYGAELIVAGLPKNMDGSEGFRAQRCVEFATLLAERLDGIAVAMIDERLTTMGATRYLNETNTAGAKRKKVIDTLSAEIILQNALDRLKN